MTTTRRLVLGLTGLLLTTAACSGPSTTTTAAAVGTAAAEQSKVLLLGDSIAVGQALPLAAAFAAGGVDFQSIAAEGGGNVVGPASDERWKELPGHISAAKPSVVVYQITTYDWGSEPEQQAAYEKLLNTVTGAGAKLVFVTMPPIRPGDFYQPHMAELARTPDVARTVAARSSGQAVVLDAGEVWGTTYQQTKDGKADRSADGIHTCPQGAARFTGWLLTQLAKVLPGFTPPAAETWANTGWSADKHFKGC
ncbi:SGNH/GDSL hydrolase family protein [Kibdelosporangium persicum]|uniref:Lysophospholipase L1 n=1 Tax=Kibdelosporangium persicum TaxID=2698649 RepID=A0ABX2F0S5_9PSEU|nr:SGNH/GDSL hydrolase family protein [Kibdelosporangium persicum]NRN64513.1 Lysophospholipase L1 [Kibdelosporangium persicum]